MTCGAIHSNQVAGSVTVSAAMELVARRAATGGASEITILPWRNAAVRSTGGPW